MKNTPMITAHSGCDGTADNSLAFVEYALSIDVDAFEVDVRKYGDACIISHDAPTDAQALVTLHDVFQLAKRKPSVSINCDLKDRDIEQDVLALAAACALPNPLIFSGWVSLEQSQAMAQTKAAQVFLNPECMFADFIERKLQQASNPSLDAQEQQEIVAQMQRWQASTLNIHHALLSPAFLDLLTQNQIGVSVWTPSTAEALHPLMHCALQNITTRTPKLALEMRAQMMQKGAQNHV